MDKIDITIRGFKELCGQKDFEDLSSILDEIKKSKIEGIIDLEKIKIIDSEIKKRIIAKIDKDLQNT